jgi:hypothetical protein
VHPLVGYGLAGSSGRQPKPEAGIRGTSTAPGPGGDALDEGAPVAPLIVTPVEPVPTGATDSREPHRRRLPHGPSPATRQRVVLLPHARTTPTDDNRRAGRATGMDHDGSPRPHPTHNGHTTRMITANTQWHDTEHAFKVARHSYDRWLVAGHQDTPSLATLHAYHTHEALHEAARTITMLIETIRAETTDHHA